MLVGDSSFAVVELLSALVRQGLICVTRLRLDAALYEPAPPRKPGTKGRSRKKGARLPALSEVLADARTMWQSVTVAGWYGAAERRLEICAGQAVWFRSGQVPLPVRWVLLRDPQNAFDPQALLCTDLARAPLCIIQWFVQRWPVEVTFREVRDHLGVESQRQWTDKAIARTTPCLLGLFSIVALLATRLSYRARIAGVAAAWYRKSNPTFADTLGVVRREIWRAQGFSTSRKMPDMQKLPQRLRDAITYALCQVA